MIAKDMILAHWYKLLFDISELSNSGNYKQQLYFVLILLKYSEKNMKAHAYFCILCMVLERVVNIINTFFY